MNLTTSILFLSVAPTFAQDEEPKSGPEPEVHSFSREHTITLPSGEMTYRSVAETTTQNFFRLFRKADVKPADIGKGTLGGRPWISLQGIVEERVNLSANTGVRNVRVKLPESLY